MGYLGGGPGTTTAATAAQQRRWSTWQLTALQPAWSKERGWRSWICPQQRDISVRAGDPVPVHRSSCSSVWQEVDHPSRTAAAFQRTAQQQQHGAQCLRLQLMSYSLQMHQHWHLQQAADASRAPTVSETGAAGGASHCTLQELQPSWVSSFHLASLFVAAVWPSRGVFPGCFVLAALGRLSGLPAATVKALAQQEPQAPGKSAFGHTLGTGSCHRQLGVCADCTSTAHNSHPEQTSRCYPGSPYRGNSQPLMHCCLLLLPVPLLCVCTCAGDQALQG